MNILMLGNTRPMNCLMTLLLDFYTSSNCFLICYTVKSVLTLSLRPNTPSILPDPQPSSFHDYFRRIANIKILLAVSFLLHFTLTLNKISNWTLYHRVRDLCTTSAVKLSPQHYFRKSYGHQNQWGLNKGLRNSNNHLVKMLYVELKISASKN